MGESASIRGDMMKGNRMDSLTIHEIKPEHRTQPKGTYNAGISRCPHCDNDMLKGMFDHVDGFCEIRGRVVIIIECDQCFEYFYWHPYRGIYELYMERIERDDLSLKEPERKRRPK